MKVKLFKAQYNMDRRIDLRVHTYTDWPKKLVPIISSDLKICFKLKIHDFSLFFHGCKKRNGGFKPCKLGRGPMLVFL